ncbi:zinc ribbon domain-containing protein [bacterium]|nr:zinc ribbon domain-containing protein [bacterium]
MLGALIWLGVALVALFVGWPLLQARRGVEPGDAEAPPLERQKREALVAIKEAEFDRAMGKLSDADFAQLTQRYREQALAAMAALEAGAPRGARGGVRLAFCPQCGTKLPPRANFCGGCGHALRPQAA